MFSFPGIKIVSFIPGRVRLRVDKVKDDDQLARRVEKELSGLACIKLVETKVDNGSVLIKYDRKLLKQAHNAEALLSTLKSLFPDFDTEKIRPYLT